MNNFSLKIFFQHLFFFSFATIIVGILVLHLIHHTPRFVDKRNLVDCQRVGALHQVEITSVGFKPNHITARACDKIEFVNRDNQYHQIAFGPHPLHLIYPGFREEQIAPDQKKHLQLAAWGVYEIHDHLNDKLEVVLDIKR